MMTKNAPLVLILLFVSLFFGCTKSNDDERDVELTSSEMSDKVMDIIVLEHEKEKAEVRKHYNQLSSQEKSNITFNQYYADLAQRYRKVTRQALADAQSMNSEEDPESQVELIQEKIADRENVPEWYWQMKQATKEKIVNLTLE